MTEQATHRDDAPDLADAFLRVSRFHSTALVLDLRYPPAPAALAGLQILSTDARRALAFARAIRARYVVLAGQLHRKKAGVFSAYLKDDDAAALCAAALAAYARLTELGETNSAWIVLAPEPVLGRVTAALAQVAAAQGSA